MLPYLIALQDTWTYRIALFFLAAYPILMSVGWITTSLFYRFRWEPDQNHPDGMPQLPAVIPKVSVLMPAHNESDVIRNSLEAVCALDYPDFEVVVVDDGSSDDARAIVEEFVAAGRVRLIAKTMNEGKALAINDAIPCLNGEIILILDADAEPEPGALRHIVPHFSGGRVGAVTGNPRVKNVATFLARLQLIEFTSIVSLLRRSQRIWGRVVTVSGVVAAFRKSALIDAGLFSPDMPTEDIELTWKLQKRFWDVRYEPNAVTWMTVPSTYRGLFRQRLRWARGLMHVLNRHRDVIVTWKLRRMWPMFVEACLSAIWAVDLVVLTSIWVLSWSLGYPPVGASPIPNFWGMTIGTLCLAQLLVGTLMDRRYDREVGRYFGYAVYYPIVYWMLMAVCTFIAIPRVFTAAPSTSVRWKSVRVGETMRRGAEGAAEAREAAAR
jgi:poly-beta-1,6-N-acetyl-D-glucosamine synthase